MSHLKGTRYSKPWVICFAASLFLFYEYFQGTIFNALNPYLLDYFSLSAVQIGFLSCCYSITFAVFLIPAGILLDKYSTKFIVCIALTVLICGTFIFSIAKSLPILIFSRLLCGAAAPFAFLSCSRLASLWFEKHQLPFIMGLIATFTLIAGMMSQTPLTLLIGVLGWQSALKVVGIIGILFLICIIFIVQNKEMGQEKLRLIKNSKIFENLFEVIKVRKNWISGIYIGLMMLPITLLGGLWGESFLSQLGHFSYFESSLVTSMLFAGMIMGSPLLGKIAKNRFQIQKILFLGSMVAFLVSLFLMKVTHHFYIEIFLFFLLGFCSSAHVLVYPLIIDTNKIEYSSTAVGFVCVLVVVVGTLIRSLFGLLMVLHWDKQHVPAYKDAMLIFPIAFIICAILADLILKPKFIGYQNKYFSDSI